MPERQLVGRNVHLSFGGVKALDGVSFSIPPRSVVAIVGPNGAGKTSLLNVVSGFQRPDSGQIDFGTVSLVGIAPHRFAKIGICRTFQNLRLAGGLSARDNLRLAGGSKSEPDSLASAVGLAVDLGTLAKNLSYGQQKLLSIACCLATDAELLLLDEPAAGLAPSLVEGLVTTLRGLTDLGKTVVVVEHDLPFVRQVSSHVMVMARGVFIAEGSALEVLSQRTVVDAYLG